MTLGFLSPSGTAGELLASPLARALADVDPDVVRDLSLDGKVELRGRIDEVEPEHGEELIRFSPRRGLLLVDGDPVEIAERLRESGVLAYDATGALAGLAFEGEQVARRLTDLDLERLPAAGMVAKLGAILARDEGERFRLYFPQELGHYVAEVVLDAIAGVDGAVEEKA
jgi:hypothetical protein